MQNQAALHTTDSFTLLINALQKKYTSIHTTGSGQQQQRLVDNLNTELFGLAYLNRWMTMGELKLPGNLNMQGITVAPPVSEAAPPASRAAQPVAVAATHSGASAKDSYAALKNILVAQERITQTASALSAALPLAGQKPALVIAAAWNHAQAGGVINEYEARHIQATKNISQAAANSSAAAALTGEAEQQRGEGEKTQAVFTVSYTKYKTPEV